MEKHITYESILELMERQTIIFNQNLERERQERELSNKRFNESLKESRKEFNQELIESRKEFNQELLESRKEFDKKLGQLTGTWGKFVAEMVQPKIVEMFQERGIAIEMSAQSVKAVKDGNVFYEIDILLVNTDIAVAVEVKSSLSIDDINEHLERLDKIKQVAPKLFNLSGMKVYGAVAGMIVEGEADKYAYKKGLFVLRQKGNIVEIVNDSKFQPKVWEVEY